MNIKYKSFEEIKQNDDDGTEFWHARELQVCLQYKEWRNFKKVLNTAKIACQISGHEVSDHFVEVNKMVDIGSGTRRKIKDYKLTRYACYLIVMNGDPRKEVIALGQTYFAVKTRQQEFNELFAQLDEDSKRLFIRGDIKQKNMLLAEAAKNAGIITNKEYAVFQDYGYKGLYAGETAKDIAERKGIDGEKESILDYMGSLELAANLFRITQTEDVMKRNNIASPNEANETHYRVGKIVRKAMTEAGNPMPEELPTPTKSTKELEKERSKKLK
ncbi:MAG: DNA damage-inducible protein D [Christensenellaceae bacterium]|jgi:DNA-damage-inducible protein D|nr:DNA damage-inducible protein D [Christensenellaceae bacterium]